MFKETLFKGTFVALATPFTESGEIDYKALYELIEWQIDSKVDGIVLCGTTGEAPTLSHEEKIKIFKDAVLISKGRVPLIAGTGNYDTRHSLHMTEEAKRAGIDGAMIVTPYYNRPTSEGCFQHFKEISKAGLPMIVYHNPGRTGIKLPVKTLVRISELPAVAAIKETSGDLDYAIELMQSTQTPVLSGDDTLTLSLMAVGAVGVISIVANLIPCEWKQLTALLLTNQWEEARALFYRFYPLAKAMVLETNPQCVKYALAAMGKCSSKMRLPLIEPKEETQQQIVAALDLLRHLTLSRH